MSQLFSFLDTEVAKYRDIENILGKLKEEGEVQTIYDFFKNIFSNEFKFTMQELGRIENEKNEKLNIQEQCQENLSMFKSNFFLIVQMIFEKAFKSASVENKTKFAQKEGLTPAETTMESVNISTVSEERGSKKKKTKKARSKSRKADSEADLSTEVVKSKSKSKAKKSSSKFNNSSLRASSPLAKIFGSTTSTRANEDGERTSFFKERSSRKSSPHPNQQSRASLQSDLYVQSEFNHVRGPGTFKRSPRRMEHGTLSPGPAAYDVDKSSLRQSPSPTIDRAMRKSWVDEIVAQNEGPGPAQHYASHHVLSK